MCVLGSEDLPDLFTGLKALSWLRLILECWLQSSRSAEPVLFLSGWVIGSSILIRLALAVTGVTGLLPGVTILIFPGQNRDN